MNEKSKVPTGDHVAKRVKALKGLKVPKGLKIPNLSKETIP